MSVAKFEELLIENDPLTILESMRADIRARFPEWEPARGDLADQTMQTGARTHSTTREQFASVAKAVFKKFGETIAEVPPILPAPATATSTWTLIDDDGHTIEAGTLATLAVDGDNVRVFEVVSDVTVEPGDTTTAAGEVVLQDTETGAEGNKLTAAPEPYSAVAFVDSIALVGETSGGVDAEDEDEYVERLREELQLRSLSLILPHDFEIDARAVAGIERALCIPGYDNEAKEEDVPLCFTVVPIDASGIESSAGVQKELAERQEAKLISGVNYFVGKPTYTEVDAEVAAKVAAGYDPETVKAAIAARLAALLSPANAGQPSAGDASNSTGWEPITHIYVNEIISELDKVAGVDRIVSVKLAKHGSTLEAKDVALAGVAALPKAETLTVSVS
jgi:hypothetical protein